MGLKRPEDDLEKFLTQQPSWLRKFLQEDYALSPDERSDFKQSISNWPENVEKARDEYLQLLEKCPQKLGEYRKLKKKLAIESAVRDIPAMRVGARLLDALAQEALELEQAGFSQANIASSLNLKYPERKDRKGNKKPFTAESVRKLLGRRRGNTPDKT